MNIRCWFGHKYKQVNITLAFQFKTGGAGRPWEKIAINGKGLRCERCGHSLGIPQVDIRSGETGIKYTGDFDIAQLQLESS